MPLSKIQTEVLRAMASQRDPESYVAGATPLNLDAPRYSGDIDVFHDREERVAYAALSDAKVLIAAGYSVRWLRQLPLVYSACSHPAGCGHAAGIADSDFRFFPTVRDEMFGYVLHPVDLAMNRRWPPPDAVKCAILSTWLQSKKPSRARCVGQNAGSGDQEPDTGITQPYSGRLLRLRQTQYSPGRATGAGRGRQDPGRDSETMSGLFSLPCRAIATSAGRKNTIWPSGISAPTKPRSSI